MIAGIAEKLGRSPAPVVPHIRRGTVEAIDALNDGAAGRIGANPDRFAYVPA